MPGCHILRKLAARGALAALLGMALAAAPVHTAAHQGLEGPSAPDTKVFLYFKERGKPYLTPEKRVLGHQDPAALGRAIVDALIHGPRTGLIRTIPVKTTLRALYIAADGIAYVDLSGDIRSGHPGGSRSERMTLFSIVNSLALNVPEIRSVKFLIHGNECETLAGHLDLATPFSADMLLNR